MNDRDTDRKPSGEAGAGPGHEAEAGPPGEDAPRTEAADESPDGAGSEWATDRLRDLAAAGDGEGLAELLDPMPHSAALRELLALSPDERSDVLTAIPPVLAAELIEEAPNEIAVELVERRLVLRHQPAEHSACALAARRPERAPHQLIAQLAVMRDGNREIGGQGNCKCRAKGRVPMLRIAIDPRGFGNACLSHWGCALARPAVVANP